MSDRPVTVGGAILMVLTCSGLAGAITVLRLVWPMLLGAWLIVALGVLASLPVQAPSRHFGSVRRMTRKRLTTLITIFRVVIPICRAGGDMLIPSWWTSIILVRQRGYRKGDTINFPFSFRIITSEP